MTEPTFNEWRERALNAERDIVHWKANHTNMVARTRVLTERTDMPLERIKAFEQIGDLQNECVALETLYLDSKEDALRFRACCHQASHMQEDGGEKAFVAAIDRYRKLNRLK